MGEACPGKSWDAANDAGNAPVETRNAARTRHAWDKPIDGEAEHAPRATTKARATEYSAGTVAKSTAAEADANAAFYPACQTGSGGETDSAFESVDTARAE